MDISSKIFAQLEINRAPIDASASVTSGSELTRDRQRMKERVLLMKLQGSYVNLTMKLQESYVVFSYKSTKDSSKPEKKLSFFPSCQF